jgi:hypothetical protein
MQGTFNCRLHHLYHFPYDSSRSLRAQFISFIIRNRLYSIGRIQAGAAKPKHRHFKQISWLTRTSPPAPAYLSSEPVPNFHILSFAACAYKSRWRQHHHCRFTQVFGRRQLLFTARPSTTSIQHNHATLRELVNVELQENLCLHPTLSKSHLTVVVQTHLQDYRAEALEVQHLIPRAYIHLKIHPGGSQICAFKSLHQLHLALARLLPLLFLHRNLSLHFYQPLLSWPTVCFQLRSKRLARKQFQV